MVDCAMQMRPKKSRSGCPWKNISSENIALLEQKKKICNFATIDDDSVGNRLSVWQE